MAESYKRQVRLSDIVPGTNPRRDFGDIGELAAAIEATGGQPVNPPVVVADGGAYRLVDGERRVRALRKIHGDEGMADVLVFTSYDDAEEAVAMVDKYVNYLSSDQNAWDMAFNVLMAYENDSEAFRDGVRRIEAHRQTWNAENVGNITISEEVQQFLEKYK